MPYPSDLSLLWLPDIGCGRPYFIPCGLCIFSVKGPEGCVLPKIHKNGKLTNSHRSKRPFPAFIHFFVSTQLFGCFYLIKQLPTQHSFYITRMKGPYFSDQSTPYKLQRVHFSAIGVLYISCKRPIFREPKSPYLLTRAQLQWSKFCISTIKTRPRRLGGCVLHCRITIFYIKIPKFEIKNYRLF